MKKLLALLLALCMLCACAVAETTDDPVVIRVGESTYTRSVVQSKIDSVISNYVSYYAQYGVTVDASDPELVNSAREYVVEGIVTTTVKYNHAVALGADTLTEAEISEVQDEYLNYFYYIAVYMLGMTDYNTITENQTLIDQYVSYYFGVSYNSLYNARLEKKLQDTATADVTVSDADVRAYYDAKVETDSAKTAAEYATALDNGESPCYVPAGLRYVKNLLIKFTDEDNTTISTLRTELSTTRNGGDEAAIAAAQAAYDQAVAVGLANIDARADEALARLDAGEDWNAVMAECTDDPGMTSKGDTGYLVYEGISFDEAFMEAQRALTNPGEYSRKAAGAYGYYIVQLASIPAEGPVPYEQVQEAMTAEALAATRSDAFTAMVNQWVADGYANGEIEVNTDLLQ